MSIRYIDSNRIINDVSIDTQNIINNMDCVYIDGIETNNQHFNLEEHDKQIRAKAEQDFQNSDYWNDYLAKVISDERADEKIEVIDIINKNIDSWWGNCSKSDNDENWYASLKMLLKELEEQE